MVWLAVPAALGLMLQADRYRYEAVGAAERQVCLDRVDRLRYHASALRREAAELDRADDAASLQTWRITWNALQRNYTTELPPLAPGDLSHYPATAKVLDDQTTALQEMLDTVGTATRDHEFYLRSDEAVQDLNGQVEDLRWQAERYRQMGLEFPKE